MAVTETSYTGNGSTTDYSFTFPYLKSTDIQVLVDNLLKTAGTDWSLANATTVQFNSAPADQSAIKIRRQTNVDSLAATFYAGSAIKSEDLNDNATQNIYVAQEINDRYLDNDGSTITGNFVLAKDADIIYEGSTSNDFETTLTVADPTADRTITLPNVTGTVVTTGDTGSVTVGMMGTNSVDSDELVADSVITSKILDDNVTYAKIQNVSATDRVLGRDSSGAGIIEEITPTALRTMINVEDGAEVNVQSDWNASSGDAQILNKPAIVELIDEDNFSSDTATKAPTQQSAKAYIDTQVSGHLLDEDDFASDSATKPPSQQSAKAYIGTYAQPKDADLTTLAGMPSATASILADSTVLESTTAKLNLLSDKSIVTTISSPTDVQIPTAQAVEERIVSLVTDVGGFRPIANETSFPATNPDPEDNAGTIVSIKALASDLTSNGSGVATIANGAGTGNTVTITGMANSDTIEAGKGILVETTTTSGDGSASPPREYTFHRETLAPADITAAKTAVDDFNQRYQVAGSQPSNQPDGTALAEGDLWFDSGTDTMKVYDGSSYAAVTSVGDYKLLTVVPDGATSGTPDYSNLSFDLRDGGSAASVTSVGQLLVSVNGVLQKPNSTSWSASNEGFHLEGSNGIKFCTAPGAGASVFVTLIGSATTVNTPATNSIQTAMIQTNQVSEEKLNISNDGDNGQFLQKQSGNDGGLTWATPTDTQPLTTEQVEDIVGGMLDGDETGITVTYDDGDGNIDFVTEVTLAGANTFTGVKTFNAAAIGEVTALTDAATVAVDLSLSNNFSLLMTSGVGNTRVLGQPTNQVAGQSGSIFITQDGTGSRALTYHTDWKWVGGSSNAPTLSTAANAVDRIDYVVAAANKIHAVASLDVK